ncbi:hypothetical protein BCR32DRAFT_246384 [Anaeromyces robustus]|uniref:Periplasmic binding protein-like II n=1 Tax=Anaeromyces robustus TaxID=1754192 RepID=A0A1Y1X0X0_9FUNG|nr:hypothetical protein BCR32DRAFT_246384 [Anaeromyces robustus]|eukprot:ORX79451.1 hypothetical protein BCR32DRAFT_246384 [Anaeromyces robustus]
MKYKILPVLFIIIFLLQISSIKCITINALTFLYPGKEELYYSLIDAFNQYSIKKNLDIIVDLTILSDDNSSAEVNNVYTSVDSLLKKKSKKYDIYIYLATYSEQYGPHFVDLSEWIQKENIDLYDSKLVKDSCLYDNKIIGLPISIDVSALYSNTGLLEKYGEKIPKTWDELLRISKHIVNEEKKLNNTNLIAYNGLFSDNDSGNSSLYEFVNSYRDSNEQSYPEPRSNKTIEAIKMIKKLKEEIGSGLL